MILIIALTSIKFQLLNHDLTQDEERKLRAKRERIAAKRKAMGLDSRGSSRPSTFGSRPGTGKIHPGSAGGDRPGTC